MEFSEPPPENSGRSERTNAKTASQMNTKGTERDTVSAMKNSQTVVKATTRGSSPTPGSEKWFELFEAELKASRGELSKGKESLQSKEAVQESVQKAKEMQERQRELLKKLKEVFGSPEMLKAQLEVMMQLWKEDSDVPAASNGVSSSSDSVMGGAGNYVLCPEARAIVDSITKEQATAFLRRQRNEPYYDWLIEFGRP